MQSVEDIARDILRREGGYVDDPNDPGGATKFGVTIGTLGRLGLDLDGDGDVTAADLRQLTEAQALDIYLEHYFRNPGIAALPTALQPPVFDMYVNAGANAVRILQRLLASLGHPVAVDGRIGAATVAAAQAAGDAAGLADAYGVARRNYYYALADARPASRKYARRRDGGKGGWITRAEEFMSQRYRLTDAEHRARVAAWG